MRERRALENLQNQQVQQLQAQQLQMQQQQLQQQMNGESRDGFLLVLGFLVLALGVWGFLWGS
jgi:hypothetical protein